MLAVGLWMRRSLEETPVFTDAVAGLEKEGRNRSLTVENLEASQAAIRKLGGTFEGVLRKHKITWTGRARDTAQFAILDEDWLEVRRRLDERLGSLA